MDLHNHHLHHGLDVPASAMPPISHWLRRHAAVLSLGVVIGAVGVMFPQQLNEWELAVTGLAQELRGRRAVPKGVVIVAIDDLSLQQAANADLSQQKDLQYLQRWPWPRSAYGMLLQRVFDAGARAVALDLMFDAPSSYGTGDDQRFASTLRQFSPRVVLGGQVLESRGAMNGVSLIQPLPVLMDAVGQQRLGLLNGFLDPDGTIRQRPNNYAQRLKHVLGEAVPPSLSVSLLKNAAIQPPQDRQPSGWQALLDPYGPPRTIPTIPIWTLLEDSSFQQLKTSGHLNNKLVLIGPTAAILQDLHHTVFAGSEGMPGVEVHATELANRLEGRVLTIAPNSKFWSLIVGAAVALMALGAERWDRPLTRLGVLGTIAIGLLLLNLALIGQLGVGLRLLSLSAGALAAGVISSTEATLRLQGQRRRLRRSLERYLSPAVAAQIADQPEEADGLLGGQLSDVVVMLSDIRSFTAFTQSMTQQGRVPELVERLNLYFSEVVSILHKHGATVDKFIGDATLAVFGAPLHRGAAVEAQSAIAAAIELQYALRTLNEHWIEQGEEPWRQVVALSYGTVISGNIGSSSRMDYTVIGDPVNTASRLEAIAKQTNQQIVLSEGLAALLEADWKLEDLGSFRIQGQEDQHVYALQSVHNGDAVNPNDLEGG